MLLELLIVFILLTAIIFILILNYLFVETSPTIEQYEIGKHIGNWRISTALIVANLIFIIKI